MSRPLIFLVEGYSGWDRALAWVPLRVQARAIARSWLRQGAADPAVTPMILQFPQASFRVLDRGGRVVPCPRAWVPMAGASGVTGGGA